MTGDDHERTFDEQVADAAQDARDEYLRALRDYSQLMRHRLANPITAIAAGVATLRDLDSLDGKQREILLVTIADAVAQLERVALHPVRLAGIEREFDPMVAVDGLAGEELRAVARQHRKGLNEAQFRRINDMLAGMIEVQAQDLVDFVCECSSTECAEAIGLTIPEYESVHAHPARFCVVAGHEDDEVENTVDRRDGWNVVEKHTHARREALSMAFEDAERVALEAFEGPDGDAGPA